MGYRSTGRLAIIASPAVDAIGRDVEGLVRITMGERSIGSKSQHRKKGRRAQFFSQWSASFDFHDPDPGDRMPQHAPGDLSECGK
jgi:hypothetical protein